MPGNAGLSFGFDVEDADGQVRAETGGFGANLSITTQDRRQSVTIDSRGGGETTETTITLRRD